MQKEKEEQERRCGLLQYVKGRESVCEYRSKGSDWVKGKRGRDWRVSDCGKLTRGRRGRVTNRWRRTAEKEEVSVNKSNSKHLQAGGPPLTGCAVCLAWPARLGRLLGMTRFNAVLSWTANGNEMGSKAVYHSAVAKQAEPAVCGGGRRRTFNYINFSLIHPNRQGARLF